MFAAAPMLVLFGMSAGCKSSPQAKETKYLRQGEALAAKKDYPRAFLEFRNAAAAMPQDAEPYYQMALAYLETGSMVDAMAALRKAVEVDPKHQRAQLKLAEVMELSNDSAVLQEAAGKLETVLSASPNDSDANDALALAEWKLGKGQEAAGRLENSS